MLAKVNAELNYGFKCCYHRFSFLITYKIALPKEIQSDTSTIIIKVKINI